MVKSYKELKTAQELNNYTRQERETQCGYSDFHWSKSGVCTSSKYGVRDNFKHTRQNTFRSELKETLSKEECNILRESYLPCMQKTDTLEKLYSLGEDDE